MQYHKPIALVFFALLLAQAAPARAADGVFEISGGFSFSRSNYSDSDYSWTRRWGASVGYHLSERSEIEFAFQDVFDKNLIRGYEDTTFHDRIYSLNWVQALTGKDFPIQPYVKIGIGQLNREAGGVYTLTGLSPPSVLDSLTVVVGAGFRLYLKRNFAIRAEATSYLTGGSISTWQDNYATSFGVSLFF